MFSIPVSYKHLVAGILPTLADKWRVTLRGDHPDYINAVYINVSIRV